MAAIEMVLRQIVAHPFDDQLLALVAIRVIALMVRHVAHVDIMNAFGHGQFPEARQGGNRRGGQSVQLVFGKKAEEMQRVIGPQIG